MQSKHLLSEQPPPPKTKGPRGPKHVAPTVENFRRSKKGGKVMRQELNKLVRLQKKIMPKKSMLDHNEKLVAYSYQGRKGQISLDELLEKVYHFFDAFLVKVRNKLQFGGRIQSWLARIEKSIVKDYKDQDLQELVSMIALSQLTATKGLLECNFMCFFNMVSLMADSRYQEPEEEGDDDADDFNMSDDSEEEQ